MNQLPLWPPILAVILAAIGYVFFWTWSKRLDREEEEARRNPSAGGVAGGGSGQASRRSTTLFARPP